MESCKNIFHSDIVLERLLLYSKTDIFCSNALLYKRQQKTLKKSYQIIYMEICENICHSDIVVGKLLLYSKLDNFVVVLLLEALLYYIENEKSFNYNNNENIHLMRYFSNEWILMKMFSLRFEPQQNKSKTPVAYQKFNFSQCYFCVTSCLTQQQFVQACCYSDNFILYPCCMQLLNPLQALRGNPLSNHAFQILITSIKK